MSDLRTAVDQLTVYATADFVPLEATPDGYTAKGVVVHCDGAMQDGSLPRYEAISIPWDHPVFENELPRNSVSRFVGQNIVMRQIKPSPKWKGNYLKFLNQPITSLQVNTDFEDSNWGLAPPEWQNWVGSVLIVRRDRKEVTPREVQMLAEYSLFGIGPDITRAHGITNPVAGGSVEQVGPNGAHHFEDRAVRTLKAWKERVGVNSRWMRPAAFENFCMQWDEEDSSLRTEGWEVRKRDVAAAQFARGEYPVYLSPVE